MDAKSTKRVAQSCPELPRVAQEYHISGPECPRLNHRVPESPEWPREAKYGLEVPRIDQSGPKIHQSAAERPRVAKSGTYWPRVAQIGPERA